MYHLRRIPFLRICLALISGILLYEYTDIVNISYAYLLLPISVALMISLQIFKKQLSGVIANRLFGAFLNIGMFAFGFLLSFYSNVENHNDYFGKNLSGEEQFLQIKLAESPVEKVSTFKLTARVQALMVDSIWKQAQGKILIYIEKDSVFENLLPGDQLLIKVTPQLIVHSGNPGAFNYQQYLSRKGILYQAYCKSDKWEHNTVHSGFSLKRVGEGFRKVLLHSLEENGIKGDEFAIASAILLGADDYLDKELRAKYTGAGAMHVLCVSGLHVGILFLILNIVLKPLDRNRYLNLLRLIIILAVLWFYAILTGLAPSVSRSALMFSLFTLGSLSGRKNISYNILAASAFILIIINPNVIFETGFQLSYSAVAAILIFFPYISKWFYIRNSYVKFFWEGCAVSLAANLGTAPIVIYYFNQFPNYFLLSNLALLLLAPLVLTLGIVFFCVAFIPFVNTILAFVLKVSIQIMNYIILFVESLPGALSENLHIDFLTLILLYLFTFFIADYFVRKRKFYLRLAMLVLISISYWTAHAIYDNLNQSKLIIYNLNKNVVVDKINGTKSLIYSDVDSLQWNQVFSFNIKNNHIERGISSCERKPLPDNGTKTFLALSLKSSKEDPGLLIARAWSDTLASFEKVVLYPERYSDKLLRKKHKPSFVVIPSNWPVWKQQKMEALCDSLRLPFHSLSKQGAYIYDF